MLEIKFQGEDSLFQNITRQKLMPGRYITTSRSTRMFGFPCPLCSWATCLYFCSRKILTHQVPAQYKHMDFMAFTVLLSPFFFLF